MSTNEPLRFEIRPPEKEGDKPRVFVNNQELPEGKRVRVGDDGSFSAVGDEADDDDFNWDNFRNEEGEIDLRAAFRAIHQGAEPSSTEEAFYKLFESMNDGPTTLETAASVILAAGSGFDAMRERCSNLNEKLSFLHQACQLMADAGRGSAENVMQLVKEVSELRKRIGSLEQAAKPETAERAG